MNNISGEIRTRLFALRDTEYRDFQSALIPTVAKERVIGVRTPSLRRLARELAGREEINEFLTDLPHQYFEENNLHFFILEQTRDFEKCLARMQAFLPYVDNWATCDQACPAVFRRHRSELLPYIKEWLESDHAYTVRFGMGMLMRLFLDEDFAPEYPEMVAACSWKYSIKEEIRSDEFSERDEVWSDESYKIEEVRARKASEKEEIRSGKSSEMTAVRSEVYYVNMMAAWYFATALAKQRDAVLPYLEERRLPAWIHNKTIQKACESRRISQELKEYLRGMKVAPEKIM